MAAHKIHLTFDEATGELAAVHRCRVGVGGHAVSHAEPVELADADGAKAALKGLLDANREEMERRATELAIEHAAALAGKAKKGRQVIKLGGTLGAVGNAQAQPRKPGGDQ